MQPDFAKGNVSANRMQNLKTRFQSYAEMQPYFATAKIQHTQPEIQIFCSPNIAPRKFSKPSNEHPALCLQAFRCIFHTQKK